MKGRYQFEMYEELDYTLKSLVMGRRGPEIEDPDLQVSDCDHQLVRVAEYDDQRSTTAQQPRTLKNEKIFHFLTR